MKKHSIGYLFLILFLLHFSCSGTKQSVPQTKPPALQVLSVQKTDVTIYRSFSTSLEGLQNVEIRPKIDGFVDKIFIDEGMYVKKGQLLFTLETNTLTQDAEAKKAQIQVYQVEVDRIKPLVEKGIVGRTQLETAQANLNKAISDYNSSIASIDYAKIISPSNGFVGDLPLKEGSLVSPTMSIPLTTISNIDKIRAYFSLSEKEYFFLIKEYGVKNQTQLLRVLPKPFLVLPDNSRYPYEGRIETVNGLTNKATGSIEFRAVFPNPTHLLKSGNSGILHIPQRVKNIVLIPQVAVVESQDKQIVYVVDTAQKVRSRVITVDGSAEDQFIVTKGLSIGEEVVIEGAYKLKEGQVVIPRL